MSEFLVRAGLDLVIRPLPARISREYLNELSRIGNNLNQLTQIGHLLKRQLSQHTDSELAEILDDQTALLDDIFEEIKRLRLSRL